MRIRRRKKEETNNNLYMMELIFIILLGSKEYFELFEALSYNTTLMPAEREELLSILKPHLRKKFRRNVASKAG